MTKQLSIIIILMVSFSLGCQKKERDFHYLQSELISMGYNGKYEKPEGALQKTAISFMGVEDALAYKGADNSFLVLKFKPGREKDAIEKIDLLIGLFDNYLSDEDRRNIEQSRNKLEEHSIRHNDIMLLWDQEMPRDVARLIKRNF